MPRCSQCHSEYAAGERFCPVDGGAIVDEAETDPLVGRKLDGRYLIRRLVGKGGMGAVYEADHVGLDKAVAIKVILDRYTEDGEAVSRFHREARTASRIGHENIVDVTDIAEVDGRHFIVMEYLQGRDLAAELRQSGPMPAARAVDIVSQVLAGLAAAHDAGVLHRDMKPENVFLCDNRGRPDFVKIMDFGISKFISAHDSNVRLTGTGKVVGTPLYMAPEQARGDDELDHRVDIYAVGVMLFELLAGRPPFQAASYLGVLTQHLHERPPSLKSVRTGIPAPLTAAVERALEKERDQRFTSAREFAAAIGGTLSMPMTPVSGSHSVGPSPGDMRYAPTVSASQVVGAAPRSRLFWWLIGGAVLAAGALVAGLAARDTGSSSEPARPSAAAPAPDAAPAPPPDIAADSIPIASPLEASLEIASEPPGATAYVDGAAIGTTPARLATIAPGEIEVRLELEGYKTLSAKKTVRQGYSETFFGALAPDQSARRGTVKRGGSKRTAGSEAKGPSGDGGKSDSGKTDSGKADSGKSDSGAGGKADSGKTGKGGKGGKGPEGKPNPFVQ